MKHQRNSSTTSNKVADRCTLSMIRLITEWVKSVWTHSLSLSFETILRHPSATLDESTVHCAHDPIQPTFYLFIFLSTKKTKSCTTFLSLCRMQCKSIRARTRASERTSIQPYLFPAPCSALEHAPSCTARLSSSLPRTAARMA